LILEVFFFILVWENLNIDIARILRASNSFHDLVTFVVPEDVVQIVQDMVWTHPVVVKAVATRPLSWRHSQRRINAIHMKSARAIVALDDRPTAVGGASTLGAEDGIPLCIDGS
jgi:hypothetical protein